MSNLFDREIPWSPEAEMSVLGGMLIDCDALEKAVERLGEEGAALYREANRKLYQSMRRMRLRGEAVDAVTLSEDLKAHGDLEAVGGMPYVAQLLDAVPTAANIEYHLGIVASKALRRRAIGALTAGIQTMYQPGDEVELLDAVEAQLQALSQAGSRGGFTWMKEIVWPVFEELERRQNNPTPITGVPSGWHDLDEITCGFQPGDLIIVAGRPSMGKSAFVTGVAQHAAIAAGTGVALFSLEMSKESLTRRILCCEARVDASRFRRGRLSDDDYARLATAAGYLNTAPIYIDDTPGLSATAIRGRARKLKREHPEIGLIIVDYLQLIAGESSDGSREQQVSATSRSLKNLAREMGVPVVALSQLSRACEQRPDKRPMMSDLRESGGLEQDADLVMFLFRPEYYYGPTDKEGNSLEGRAEVIIGKQRDGAVGTIPLMFLKEYVRFESFSRREDPMPRAPVEPRPRKGTPYLAEVR